MHIFGTICYSYIQEKKKLDPCSEKGIFVGYDGQSPAYVVYFPHNDDVKRVRCVKFTDKFQHEVREPDVRYTTPLRMKSLSLWGHYQYHCRQIMSQV